MKTGAIRQFFVMAGCDGRMKSRNYYTDFAKELPQDTVIMTAGCAKYKYNKLDLGVKNIHLGPTLPAFLSPNVVQVLVDNFGIAGITNVEDDMKMFLEA